MLEYQLYKNESCQLLIIGNQTGLHSVSFIRKDEHLKYERSKEITVDDLRLKRAAGSLDKALKQIDEYFRGERKDFKLSLSPVGTVFQQKVWKELQKIPYGQTIDYKTLATRIGNPNASRAVGMANSKNPIGIVIPCHRVIGANGKLTGYAGGLDNKQLLLELEQSI